MASLPRRLATNTADAAGGLSSSQVLLSKARLRRLVHFSIVGGACTVAFAVLFNVFRSSLGPLEANLAALSLTMAANFVANRWFTFGLRGGSIVGDAAGYLLVYLIGMVGSSAVLWLSLSVVLRPDTAVQTLLALASGGVATVVRYVLLSAWVFRRSAVTPAAAAPR